MTAEEREETGRRMQATKEYLEKMEAMGYGALAGMHEIRREWAVMHLRLGTQPGENQEPREMSAKRY